MRFHVALWLVRFLVKLVAPIAGLCVLAFLFGLYYLSGYLECFGAAWAEAGFLVVQEAITMFSTMSIIVLC